MATTNAPGGTFRLEVYFSDYFGVAREEVEAAGAFDISLVADLPLFVDPFLLFSSPKPEYRALHDRILDYLRFLRAKAGTDSLDPAIRKSLYSFKEVKQNWLGFTRTGNQGSGLGAKFATSLHNNLHTIFSNFGAEQITKGSHLEKLCLIDSGVGRDRISDFTTRLILEYLCEYTQAFAREKIASDKRKVFSVERAVFNYDVQVWLPKKFELPSYRGEFVLLTPADMLTRDDTWISRHGLFSDFQDVPDSIENPTLRAQINDYFLRQLPKEPSSKEVAKAIDATIREYPAVVDYYIRYKEEHEEDARLSSAKKVSYSQRIFLDQASRLAMMVGSTTRFYEVPGDTFKESLERLQYLKHIIEDRDGYKTLYADGQPIAREEDIHVMFDLVWYGSPSDVNKEVDNGRGPADFAVSRGAADKTIVEFKLASNSQLKRNLEKQTEIYEKAARAKQKIKAIVYFTEDQETKVRRILRELKLEGAENIVLIDARADNKPSASKA